MHWRVDARCELKVCGCMAGREGVSEGPQRSKALFTAKFGKFAEVAVKAGRPQRSKAQVACRSAPGVNRGCEDRRVRTEGVKIGGVSRRCEKKGENRGCD